MSGNEQQDVDMTDVSTTEQQRYATFVDLPSELRTYLYSTILARNTPEAGFNLADFDLPVLAQVPEIAREVLPVLFAESHFYVQVKSNFEDRRQQRLTGTHQGLMTNACGNTRMRGHVRQAVRKAGKAALFRNITIRVVEPYMPAAGCTDRYVTTHIRMKVVRGNLQFVAVPGANQNGPWDREDVDAAVQAVRAQAEGAASVPEFKGFNLRQLEAIVRALSGLVGVLALIAGLLQTPGLA